MTGLEGRIEVLEDNSSRIIRHANALQRAVYGFAEEATSPDKNSEHVAGALQEAHHHIQNLLLLVSGTIAILKDMTEEIL
jgi:thiamine phosphate synthase YjbQ (UPF0047 family)